MNINPKIFKAYDIRGIYPEELNEENIAQIIKAIFLFLKTAIQKENFTIVLGRDMRLSSPALFEVSLKTLLKMGANIIDVGLISTPSFYFSVFHYGYDAGIQITASHNPKQYNGIKIVRNSPHGLVKIGQSTGMEEIKKTAEKNNLQVNALNNGAVLKKGNILSDEVENALQLFGNPKIEKFKIAADPANAMGIQYIDALFKKVPADLIKMNFTMDGNLPSHEPNPLDFNNLIDLQKKVLDEKADFGLAPDGDGDRLFFIDEKGQIVPATIVTALVAKELLKINPGATILFDVRYIFTPQKIVEECGGKSQVTRVGHAFITEQMSKTGAVFAGESSAHYYYKSNGNAESQLTTIISVLKVLTEKNKPLSAIVKELQRSHESGEINFTVNNAKEIMDKIKEKYKNGVLDTTDGIAINYPDWRFSVRTSNTEPLLRLNLEAYEKNLMEQKRNEIVELINSLKI